MKQDVLACPACGTVILTYTPSGGKMVFRVNTLSFPLGIDKVLCQDAGQADLTDIRCGNCFWRGGVRELVSSYC